jgi:hypothetical protein
MTDIEKIISSMKTTNERVIEILKGVRKSYEEFLQNLKAFKETDDKHYLVIADEKSTEVLRELVRIVDILKETNDQDSVRIIINMINDIMNLRKSFGLKT